MELALRSSTHTNISLPYRQNKWGGCKFRTGNHHQDLTHLIVSAGSEISDGTSCIGQNLGVWRSSSEHLRDAWSDWGIFTNNPENQQINFLISSSCKSEKSDDLQWNIGCLFMTSTKLGNYTLTVSDHWSAQVQIRKNWKKTCLELAMKQHERPNTAKIYFDAKPTGC